MIQGCGVARGDGERKPSREGVGSVQEAIIEGGGKRDSQGGGKRGK